MLGGALATLGALPRVAPIVHASQGCGGNLFMAYSSGSGYFGAGYCGGNSVSCSGVLEKDIVFGGIPRLEEQIATTFETIDADLFVVLTSCMTEIIGDDVKGLTARFAAETEHPPIFNIETPGFAGNSYHGYEKVMEGLFRNFIPPSAEKDARLVNIFGVIPAYDPFFRGDLEEIRRILQGVGLKVNTFFTSDISIEDVKAAGRASFNISFSRIYGRSLLAEIEATQGIPFGVFDMPVGAQATREFLLSLSEVFPIAKERIPAFLEKEFSRYYSYVERGLELYADADFQQYGVLVSNANRAVSYAKYLVDEIGWILKYVFVTDDLREEEQQAIRESFDAQRFVSAPALVFETDGENISRRFAREVPLSSSARYFDAFSPAFVLGSSIEKDFARAIGANLLTVSFPIMDRLIASKAYAGFNGGLSLFEDIVSRFTAPR
jgi:nitrogenase molybdenum-iron protein beta chain